MNLNKSLEDTTISSEEENFYFDRLTGKPYWDLRKMLGRQLFKIRQEKSKPLHVVAKALNIPEKIIDAVELGSDYFHWDAISKLLNYYKKRVKLSVVEMYSAEEKQEHRIEKANQIRLEQADLIIAQVHQREELEKQFAAAEKMMANPVVEEI